MATLKRPAPHHHHHHHGGSAAATIIGGLIMDEEPYQQQHIKRSRWIHVDATDAVGNGTLSKADFEPISHGTGAATAAFYAQHQPQYLGGSVDTYHSNPHHHHHQQQLVASSMPPPYDQYDLSSYQAFGPPQQTAIGFGAEQPLLQYQHQHHHQQHIFEDDAAAYQPQYQQPPANETSTEHTDATRDDDEQKRLLLQVFLQNQQKSAASKTAHTSPTSKEYTMLQPAGQDSRAATVLQDIVREGVESVREASKPAMMPAIPAPMPQLSPPQLPQPDIVQSAIGGLQLQAYAHIKTESNFIKQEHGERLPHGELFYIIQIRAFVDPFL